ncbi:MAG: carboxynorspermidine decarboxylase [Alloprevotella sp.]|nr:carboxynorspermidine decarboxylase [Alloprevotella sp.]
MLPNTYPDLNTLPLPCYVVEESLLRRNLELISDVAGRAGVEFILAFKAFALWKTFGIFRDYVRHTTASSPYEARMALEKFGTRAHTYSPAYEEGTFPEILRCSSHVTFNSLSQYDRFSRAVATASHAVSVGLRINPEHSPVGTLLYNPCAPGSRFGILADQLPAELPPDIEGFHCHVHCESSSYDLEETLHHVERKFGRWLPQLCWLNLGGGHLLTRSGYDADHLVRLLRDFKARYPNLKLILEPGSAFAWQTGFLAARVIDIVANDGIKTAVLNVSFTCHMPDCLEMPYHPAVRGAETLEGAAANGHEREACVYRLGGNSCLAGDWMGYWCFAQPLQVGDILVFEDMIHYTTVKTTMFNGIHHPAIVLLRADGSVETLRRYSYEDYLNRMN